jgi:hypothetical protein
MATLFSVSIEAICTFTGRDGGGLLMELSCPFLRAQLARRAVHYVGVAGRWY